MEENNDAVHAAFERVAKYLAERATMKGLHQEEISGLHAGDDREANIFASDLRLMIAAHAAQSEALATAREQALEEAAALIESVNDRAGDSAAYDQRCMYDDETTAMYTRQADIAAIRALKSQPAAASSPVQAQPVAVQSEPERMTTDESREYLVKFMEQHFTDKTYHRYIRGERGSVNLAGDFAWQMARALRMLATPTQPAQQPGDGWRKLFWDLAGVLKCLPSCFIDDNGHVFKAAERAMKSIAAQPADQHAAGESMDTQVFQKLMFEYGFAGRIADAEHSLTNVEKMHAAYKAIIAHIDAWASRRPAAAPTRLDVMSLIHSQMHRVYASAIDGEDLDTRHMTEIEDAIMGIYHGRYIAGYDLRKSEDAIAAARPSAAEDDRLHVWQVAPPEAEWYYPGNCTFLRVVDGQLLEWRYTAKWSKWTPSSMTVHVANTDCSWKRPVPAPDRSAP